MCNHIWIIEPNNKAVSKGRCKECGARRTFQNRYTAAEIRAFQSRLWLMHLQGVLNMGHAQMDR